MNLWAGLRAFVTSCETSIGDILAQQNRGAREHGTFSLPPLPQLIPGNFG